MSDGKWPWLSLEEIDDDPVRFWAYVNEAFGMVDAGSGEGSAGPAPGSGSAGVLTQLVIPQLPNELAAVDSEVVLVLDDLQATTNPLDH